MAKKYRSGARKRKRKKLGLARAAPGRPRGSDQMADRYLAQLHRDIVHGIWEKIDTLELLESGQEIVGKFSIPPVYRPKPDWLQLTRDGNVHAPKLIEALRMYWPERYGHLKDETLKRYVRAVVSFAFKGGPFLFRKPEN
jgi:hypothetical protein